MAINEPYDASNNMRGKQNLWRVHISIESLSLLFPPVAPPPTLA
jgi:hypothetical protein